MRRPPRLLGLAVLLVAVPAVVAGCSGATSSPASSPAASGTSSPAASVTGSQDAGQPTAPSSAVQPSVPPLAGTSEAARAASLPDGAATGSVDITYDGLGEARSPFTGTCARQGAATTVRGTAGSAQVVLVFDPHGTKLTVDDVGMTSTAAVAAGDLRVDNGHLSLDAPLVQAGQVIGHVQMDVACSG